MMCTDQFARNGVLAKLSSGFVHANPYAADAASCQLLLPDQKRDMPKSYP